MMAAAAIRPRPKEFGVQRVKRVVLLIEPLESVRVQVLKEGEDGGHGVVAALGLLARPLG